MRQNINDDVSKDSPMGSQAVKVVINNNCTSPGFSWRIGVAEEYCKVTGGLWWKSRALSRNKQNLAWEFLQSLMPNEHPASHFNNHGMWVDFQSISNSDSMVFSTNYDFFLAGCSLGILQLLHRILWLNFICFLIELWPSIIILLLLDRILLLLQFLIKILSLIKIQLCECLKFVS